MSRHTPGPWELFIGGNFIRIGNSGYIKRVDEVHNLGKKAGGICEMDMDLPFRADAEALANAVLIAAAPDLLQTCEVTLDRLQKVHMADGRIADDLRRVIAKAKGETP